jgi:hypothetical protein
MEPTTRYRVQLYPGTATSAAAAKMFDSRNEAQQYIDKHGAARHNAITEVDGSGRQSQPHTLPVASTTVIGDQFICTHCRFVSDLPNVAHDCVAYGRDDSLSLEPKERTAGQLTEEPTHCGGMSPDEYIVDWVSDGTREKWRALLRKGELWQLRGTNSFLGWMTFEMDAVTLRKFGFRHLRKM